VACRCWGWRWGRRGWRGSGRASRRVVARCKYEIERLRNCLQYSSVFYTWFYYILSSSCNTFETSSLSHIWLCTMHNCLGSPKVEQGDSIIVLIWWRLHSKLRSTIVWLTADSWAPWSDMWGRRSRGYTSVETCTELWRCSLETDRSIPVSVESVVLMKIFLSHQILHQEPWDNSGLRFRVLQCCPWPKVPDFVAVC
jgi:hypothetical protein